MLLSRRLSFAGGLALLVCAGVTLGAQVETPGRMTDQERANLALVLDWWRVLQSSHAELVPKFVAPDLVQHNPNVGQGAAAIQQLLSGRTPVNPLPDALKPEQLPILALSQGDIVTLIWDRVAKDPADPSKAYHYNAFDAFRIKNGKVAEHWDAAMKNPPAR